METCRGMVNLMDVSFKRKTHKNGWPCSGERTCLQLVPVWHHTPSVDVNISVWSLTKQQDSGNAKLGLGEFATLWKKVQRYLVRRHLSPVKSNMSAFSCWCLTSVSSCVSSPFTRRTTLTTLGQWALQRWESPSKTQVSFYVSALATPSGRGFIYLFVHPSDWFLWTPYVQMQWGNFFKLVQMFSLTHRLTGWVSEVKGQSDIILLQQKLFMYLFLFSRKFKQILIQDLRLSIKDSDSDGLSWIRMNMNSVFWCLVRIS